MKTFLSWRIVGVRRGCLALVVTSVVSASLASAPLAVHAEEPTALAPSEFAYGVKFERLPSAGVQHVELPLAVLGLLGAQRQELRVYNAEGEAVPHAFRRLESQVARGEVEQRLPFFPLAGGAAEAGTGVDIRYTRDARGTIVRVRAADDSHSAAPNVTGGTAFQGAPGAADAVAEPVEILIDTSALSEPVAALRFALTPRDAEFVWKLELDHSDDLFSFRPLGVQGSLANLSHQGARIETRELVVGRPHDKYLRLRWTGRAPATVDEVAARVVTRETAEAMRLASLAASRAPGAPGSLLFDLGASVHVQRAALRLPEVNTLVEAVLSSRTDHDAPLEARYAGTFFHLAQRGVESHSSPVSWPASAARYFQLDVKKGGNVNPEGITLEVGYVPEQLLFLPRGKAPFTVAFGRYEAAPSAFSAEQLLADLPARARDLESRTALSWGEQFTLGGPAALLRPEKIDTKRYALWAILLAVVAVLGAVTWRVWKRLDAEG